MFIKQGVLMKKLFKILLVGSVATAASAQVAAPVPDQVAYSVPSGKGWAIHISDDNGVNYNVVFSSSHALHFALGPRSSNILAIDDGGVIKLLPIQRSGSGYSAAGPAQVISNERTGSSNGVAVSQDGRLIAFAGGAGANQLKVYDRASGSPPSTWAPIPYVFDLAFYSDGSGIAVVSPPDNNSNPDRIYKVSGPNVAPVQMLQAYQIVSVGSAHTSPALVITYRTAYGDGGDRIGLVIGTNITQPRIDNSTSIADNGRLNCADNRLSYSAPNSARQSVWYLQELNTGLRTLYSKQTGIHWLQFFPTC